ncbi:MAG TPA: hypothetical protein VEB18_00615 [Candidatus Paceibacterota bacterium]|nr:hypothetical protein [Candidatus Paceibacterota bacterium]
MSESKIQKDIMSAKDAKKVSGIDSLVLEKSIFSNVFDKDIRRVYLYKKAERIAKALHLIAPAFKDSKTLQERLDRVSVGLIDASILPPMEARDALSRELLALSSLLALARAGGHLSPMNAEIISNEAGHLLHEIASYEEPKVLLEEAPTLATISRAVFRTTERPNKPEGVLERTAKPSSDQGQSKGHISDKPQKTGRRDAILSILSTKGPSYIKDLSTMIRDVSEKTIQRELQALVSEGRVQKTGERRWTTYTLAAKS